MVNIWFVFAAFLTGVLLIELALKPLLETALSDPDTSPDATKASTDDEGLRHRRSIRCLECGTKNDHEYAYCYECQAQLDNHALSVAK